jgi:hypothetical protein
MMKDGEDKYVANRLLEIFSAAAVPGAFSGSRPRKAV